MTRSDPALRILMLAPEPFFTPRGTPFSEYHRIKALGELGHHVDLVTYPFGVDVDLPNLRIIRSPQPPFVSGVAVGPSMVKAVLDVGLTLTILRQVRRERYDAIHSHEEMGLLGVWLAGWMGIPHLYDMHSSLPQQLTNFRYTGSTLVRRLFETIERTMVGRSAVVITICQQLQDTVVTMGHGDRAILIENVMGGDVEARASATGAEIRADLGIGPDQVLVLYTGTFETYQGMDLLTAATARLQRTHPSVAVVVVGGEPAQIATARTRAERDGARVIFTGRRPAREIPAYIEACDVLVSPRTAGTNTPLKIYSYLRSGKPIVATDLLTHTQVLDPSSAALSAPEPSAFAAAVARLLECPEEAARLVRGARRLAETSYSRASYLARTREACDRLAGRRATPRDEGRHS